MRAYCQAQFQLPSSTYFNLTKISLKLVNNRDNLKYKEIPSKPQGKHRPASRNMLRSGTFWWRNFLNVGGGYGETCGGRLWGDRQTQSQMLRCRSIKRSLPSPYLRFCILLQVWTSISDLPTLKIFVQTFFWQKYGSKIPYLPTVWTYV